MNEGGKRCTRRISEMWDQRSPRELMKRRLRQGDRVRSETKHKKRKGV